MSERVVLYDTTLRDGTQQEGLTLSLADKLKIARRLDDAGFAYIEGGWPGSNPKDEQFFEAARDMTWQNARISAFGATRHRAKSVGEDPNVAALVAAETPVVTIFGKSWLLHVTDVLGATPDENLAMIGDTVGHLAAGGREVVYDAEHFFDGFKADAAYALATLRRALAAGATTLVLCDTNGGCLTDEVSDITARVLADPELAAAAPTFGIHVHDDMGLSVANSMAAVAAGVRHVQGTINGYGERCGNANLVTIWANLALKAGVETVPTGLELTGLTELAHYVAEVVNIAPDAYAPYVGGSAFAHKGGVHGAATTRVEHAYQHIDPALVGGQTRLVVSELGGRANAAWRLGNLPGVDLDAAALSRLVKELEAEGAAFEGADASLELLIRRRGGEYRPPFRVVDYTVIVEQRDESRRRAEASVKVEVGGETLHSAGVGNGPVHALDTALRRALAAFYPVLETIHLVDYKVRIVDGSSATAARTRVIIETGSEHGTWATAGADTNIIAASLEALKDSFEYALWRIGPSAVAEPAPSVRPVPVQRVAEGGTA